ncbi:MAG TPA: GIY-YIG nuclease family protein [Pantanalinema sp.]
MSLKEELKADYRQNWHRLRKMGVYQIKNQVNGKVFIEASLNLDGAIARDRLWLPRGGHLNHKLQQDWKTFGPDAFTFEILETLTPTDDPRDYAGEVALLLEVWKEQLEPYGDKGYLSPPRR